MNQKKDLEQLNQQLEQEELLILLDNHLRIYMLNHNNKIIIKIKKQYEIDLYSSLIFKIIREYIKKKKTKYYFFMLDS